MLEAIDEYAAESRREVAPVNETYDRPHVDSVLRRIGMSQEHRDALLDGIRFPIDADELGALLLPLGITHDAVIDHMGGSP